MANTGSTLAQLEEWDTSAREQQTQIGSFIFQAQTMRRDIRVATTEELDDYTQDYPPGLLRYLSDLLNEADGLLAEEVASDENSDKWEDRLDDAVQQDGPVARRVAKRIRSLIGRLKVCQGRAAELDRLVQATRFKYNL
jgi:hypothetical protein